MATERISVITDELVSQLDKLTFGPPVSHVYNPLQYARSGWDAYVGRYGNGTKKTVLIGMNPGPWGMAQTGVPFGEITFVRDWLKIETTIDKPPEEHPKKPVDGFRCHRSEVSGKRLWGWAADRFQQPESFFRNFFVANYCPLLFLEEGGRNLTPNTLPRKDRMPLLEVCDHGLRQTIGYFQPEWVIGIGRFAHDRAAKALSGMDCKIGCITHPSPANPKANRGWVPLIEKEFDEMGISI